MVNSFWQNQTMEVLKTSMDAVSLRHKAIANNITNINTPNYKRQVVNFEEELNKYLQDSQIISLKHTSSRHIFNKNLNFLDIKPVIEEDISTLRTDGNNVDVDLELAILAENTVKFNVLSQTINKKYSILRSVIRGGR